MGGICGCYCGDGRGGRYVPLRTVTRRGGICGCCGAGMDRGRAEEARWVWMMPTRQHPTDEPTSRPYRFVLRAVRREDDATTLTVASRHIPVHTVTYRYTYLEQAEDLDLAQAQLITGCHGVPPVAEQAVTTCWWFRCETRTRHVISCSPRGARRRGSARCASGRASRCTCSSAQ